MFPPGPWRERAGKRLPKSGALTHIRLDLLAVWEYMGMLRWSHPRHPCYMCGCAREALHRFRLHAGWAERSAAIYLNQVAERTIPVRVAKEQVETVLAALSSTWKTHGRELETPLREFRLTAGDALAVGGDVTDIWELEHLRAVASERDVNMVFVRLRGAAFKFANPLMSVVGVSAQTLCICRMHSFDMGPVAAWCATVIWRLLEARWPNNPGLEFHLPVFDEKCNIVFPQAECLGPDPDQGLNQLSRGLRRWWPRGVPRARKKLGPNAFSCATSARGQSRF